MAVSILYNDYIRYLKNHIKELGVKYVLGENIATFRADVVVYGCGCHDCATPEYLFSPGKVKSVARLVFNYCNDDFETLSVTFQSDLIVGINLLVLA
jgi:hypothetical protein